MKASAILAAAFGAVAGTVTGLLAGPVAGTIAGFALGFPATIALAAVIGVVAWISPVFGIWIGVSFVMCAVSFVFGAIRKPEVRRVRRLVGYSVAADAVVLDVKPEPWPGRSLQAVPGPAVQGAQRPAIRLLRGGDEDGTFQQDPA